MLRKVSPKLHFLTTAADFDWNVQKLFKQHLQQCFFPSEPSTACSRCESLKTCCFPSCGFFDQKREFFPQLCSELNGRCDKQHWLWISIVSSHLWACGCCFTGSHHTELTRGKTDRLSLCYCWFYFLALLALLIKCLRTHKYIQALHTYTHTSLTRQLSSNERQKGFRLMHRGHVCTERRCFCDFYIWCVILSAVLFYPGLLTIMPKPSEPRS